MYMGYLKICVFFYLICRPFFIKQISKPSVALHAIRTKGDIKTLLRAHCKVFVTRQESRKTLKPIYFFVNSTCLIFIHLGDSMKHVKPIWDLHL